MEFSPSCVLSRQPRCNTSISAPMPKSFPKPVSPGMTLSVPLTCRTGRLRHHPGLHCPAEAVAVARGGAAVDCVRRCLIPELEEEKEGSWMEEERGKTGLVELMECLEQEAIMGEDEGRDPTDYNRRAEIFDKSSRVFQAFKAQKNPPSHQQDTDLESAD